MRTNFAAVYAPLPGNLTVSENLRVFGMLYGVRDLTARIDTLRRSSSTWRDSETPSAACCRPASRRACRWRRRC